MLVRNEYVEEKMEDIIAYYVSAFKMTHGDKISDWDWYHNPETGKVMLKLTVTNGK